MVIYELLRFYKVGERDFTGANLRFAYMTPMCCLRGINLSSANLSGAVMMGVVLIDVNSSNANLQGASLLNSCLINVNLSGADLRSADLRGAKWIDVNLTGADLTRANLDSACLAGVNLSRANLSEIKTTEETVFCQTTMPDGSIQNHPTRVVDAQELLLRYAAGEREFEQIVMYRTNLSGAELRLARILGGIFIYINLSGANWSPGRLLGTVIGCDFRNANLNSWYVDNTRLICSDFRGANLTKVSPEAATFIGCNFQGAKWIRASGRFEECLIHTTWVDGNIIYPIDSDFYCDRDKKL